MPIFQSETIKFAVSNEDKTRLISIEIPRDMKGGELLDRVNDFRAALIEAIRKENETQQPVEKNE